MQTSLPKPDTEALAHSLALKNLIQQDIVANNGWLNFAQFMDAALYKPGFGYYSGGAKKFGMAGDFVTAPEISPLFAKTIARQGAQILGALQQKNIQGDILELGAGTGRLAKDLMLELAHLEQLPKQYMILEVSAYLRKVQQATMADGLPPEIMSRVVWLDALPETFDGLMFANEVLDALPVRIVRQEAEAVVELGVGVDGDEFVWQAKHLSDVSLNNFITQLQLPEGYTTEVCPAATALLTSLGSKLNHGVIIMVDYGFSRSEYYHPQRNQGTLMCHYRHYAHDDPMLYLGLQDITAHVDFTRVAEAGVVSGLQLVGFLTQAQFLINAGITDLLQAIPASDAANYLPLVASAQKLLSPSEMGDLFKVIAFEKNLALPFIGFSSGDKAHTL